MIAALDLLWCVPLVGRCSCANNVIELTLIMHLNAARYSNGYAPARNKINEEGK